MLHVINKTKKSNSQDASKTFSCKSLQFEKFPLYLQQSMCLDASKYAVNLDNNLILATHYANF